MRIDEACVLARSIRATSLDSRRRRVRAGINRSEPQGPAEVRLVGRDIEVQADVAGIPQQRVQNTKVSLPRLRPSA